MPFCDPLGILDICLNRNYTGDRLLGSQGHTKPVYVAGAIIDHLARCLQVRE